MARPRLTEDQKRTKTINVAFSETELSQIDQLRGKIPRAVFLRRAILNGVNVVPQVNRDMYQESSRWASNLNQIARHLNAGGQVGIETLQDTLRAFRNALLGCEHEE